MAKKISKRTLMWIIASVAVVAGRCSSAFGSGRRSKPRCRRESSSGNGRLEAKLVDVAAKEPLRVKEILVNEGDDVKPGQVLVQLDTVTLEAELAEANAGVAAAQERLALAKASIVKQQSEIDLAETEADRSRNLVAEARRLAAGPGRPQHEGGDDQGHAHAGARRRCKTAKQEVDGRARERRDGPNAHRRRDAQVSGQGQGPVSPGRARRGARCGRKSADAGQPRGRLHGDLPAVGSRQPSVKIGAEGRITVDYDPKRAVAGHVSFVSPEAQFTPKQVETQQRAREADVPRQDPAARRSSPRSTSIASRPACAASAT